MADQPIVPLTHLPVEAVQPPLIFIQPVSGPFAIPVPSEATSKAASDILSVSSKGVDNEKISNK